MGLESVDKCLQHRQRMQAAPKRNVTLPLLGSNGMRQEKKEYHGQVAEMAHSLTEDMRRDLEPIVHTQLSVVRLFELSEKGTL